MIFERDKKCSLCDTSQCQDLQSQRVNGVYACPQHYSDTTKQCDEDVVRERHTE